MLVRIMKSYYLLDAMYRCHGQATIKCGLPYLLELLPEVCLGS